MIRTLFPKDMLLKESVEQLEFDFSWDSALNMVEKAAAAVRCQQGGTRTRVYTEKQLKRPSDAELWMQKFENGKMIVASRFKMFDPLDSDFVRQRSAFLKAVEAGLPEGFSCEYDDGDLFRSDRSETVRGDKLIISKDVEIDSTSSGREEYATYDVVETLVVSKKS